MPNLSDIFGQDSAIERLRNAYRADRLPHGLIFAGPIGVGKSTTASALAALFLCEKPTKDQTCGKCQSCRAMSVEQHPDYHVIHKELIRIHDKTGKSKGTTVSIDVIRPELIEKASRKSVLGQGKVFVIEQAELMQVPAQNAMLKTLEEPHGRALIILLTDAPGLLLPTIRSRCQIVPFAPLDETLVRDELVRQGTSRADASQAAALSGGSVGLAQHWLADGVVARATDLLAMLDELTAGRAASGIQAWLKKAADDYAEKQLVRDPLSSKEQAARDGVLLYLKIVSDHFRKHLRAATDPEELEQTCSAIDEVVRAERYLDSNVSLSLVLQQFAVAIECAVSRANLA